MAAQCILDENCRLNMLTLVSHDLKSPISATLGLAELWLMRLKQADAAIDRNELMADLDIFVAAHRDMLQLIHNSLAAARLEAGCESIEARWETGLGEMIVGFGETFRVQAKAASIDLQVEVSPNLPPVYWDVCKIRFHVLDNLVSNALKFVKSGGTVRLSVANEAGEVVIRVADDGPGIPITEREKIFNRFARLEVGSERAFQGAGLGLYSANLFVRQHGGKITVEDGLEGRGVTFKVAIPVGPQLILQDTMAA